MVNKFLKNTFMYAVFLFLYFPIIFVIIYSFNDSRISVKWEGFTLKWYYELLQDERILTSLYYTLIVALISSVIATIVGTFSAIGIYKMRTLSKKIILNINYLPILNPDIVTGISLMTLFAVLNLKRGLLTMILAHIMFSIPYVILSVLPKLRQLQQDTLEAALDLGASPMYALMKVIIPQIKPGIIAGFLLAFTLSVDDFVISFFTTGRGVSNLSIAIYSMSKRGINPKINAVLSIMFLFVLVILLIINFKKNKERIKS